MRHAHALGVGLPGGLSLGVALQSISIPLTSGNWTSSDPANTTWGGTHDVSCDCGTAASAITLTATIPETLITGAHYKITKGTPHNNFMGLGGFDGRVEPNALPYWGMAAPAYVCSKASGGAGTIVLNFGGLIQVNDIYANGPVVIEQYLWTAPLNDPNFTLGINSTGGSGATWTQSNSNANGQYVSGGELRFETGSGGTSLFDYNLSLPNPCAAYGKYKLAWANTELETGTSTWEPQIFGIGLGNTYQTETEAELTYTTQTLIQTRFGFARESTSDSGYVLLDAPLTLVNSGVA